MLKSTTRVAVLAKRFPKLSETFILNEFLGLEANGVALDLFHLYPASDKIVHPDVSRLKARNVMLAPASLRSCAGMARRKPLASIVSLWRLFRHEGRGALSAWRKAVAFAESAAPADLLYAHFIDLPASIVEAAARLSGKPYAISAHAKDIYLTSPRGVRRKLDNAQFTTTCTAHNFEFLKTLAPRANLSCNHHGVDAARLAAPARNADGAPLILAIGRLRPKKGFDLLVEACALLKTQGVRFRCEIIGYGPEEPALRALIEARGLGGDVRLAGKTPHTEVVERLHQASLFAMPSRILADGDRDGVPNVVLEAMAASLPVVASNVSGLPEAVAEGETGLLIPTDDARALAAAIATLLADSSRAAKMGEAGARRVAAQFTIAHSADALTRLIDDTVNARRGRVGYVVKGYPRLSEAFISNEIRILREFGLPIEIYAIKKGDALAADALKENERRLTYLPPTTSLSNSPFHLWLVQNAPAYCGAMARLFVRRPRAFLLTLVAAVAMGRRYRAEGAFLRKVFLKEFMQAAFIARRALAAGDIRHLHGHFCHGVATVTWFASRLSGMTFSFTAHAKDIYEAQQNPGDLLARKIAAARFVVTCTSANREHLIGRCCDEAGPQLHTIYHGLDVAAFSPRRIVARNAAQVLAVGRHVPKKGFDVLIDACALLTRRGVDFVCSIVGEEGEMTARLRAQISRLGLEDAVTIEPPLPQIALRDRYAQASIFVMPCMVAASGDRDGIPNVLAEAMAMALPVVTTPVSGIPEIIRHEENGLFTPPGEPAALADAIERLIADAALCDRLGAAARATIVEIFDSAKTTRRLFDLFETALAERRAA